MLHSCLVSLALLYCSGAVSISCEKHAGLAIKDFWGVDADTVVFVADPGLGNILNFNVGENVDLMVPSVSLLRL